MLWQITLVIQSKKIMNALHGCGVPITFQYNESHEKLNDNEVESKLVIATMSIFLISVENIELWEGQKILQFQEFKISKIRSQILVFEKLN